MIFTRLQVRNFRSLEQVDQRLSRFQALVGPNASGKSTFLDVFNFLKDLMKFRDVREAVGQRGADFSKLLWRGQGDSFQIALEAKIPDDVHSQLDSSRAKFDHIRYELEIGLDKATNEIGLNHETLWLFSEIANQPSPVRRQASPSLVDAPPLFWKKQPGRSYIINKKLNGHTNFYSASHISKPYPMGRMRSALFNIPFVPNEFGAALWLKDKLEFGIQNLILDSQKIRRPSPPGLGNRFQTDGSNLPWVIEELRKSPDRFQKWLDHVQTAFGDIRSIRTIERAEDRHRYLVIDYKNGAKVPSWLVSDGTLRLLALTIPAYIKGLREVFLIEEPENGIHPQAIETVVQSLQSIYQSQVLIATHSPFLIDQLDLDEMICFAKNSTGATDTVRGNDHPLLRNWQRGRPNLSDLTASGILN